MTVITQDTEYSCVLACVESFFRDHGKPISQRDLIQTCSKICQSPYAGAGGIEGIPDLQKIGDHYRFSVEVVDKRQVPDSPQDGEGYLIFTQGTTNHCVRYMGKSLENQSDYVVMNPSVIKMQPNLNIEPHSAGINLRLWGGTERWTDARINAERCMFIRIELNPSGRVSQFLSCFRRLWTSP